MNLHRKAEIRARLQNWWQFAETDRVVEIGIYGGRASGLWRRVDLGRRGRRWIGLHWPLHFQGGRLEAE